MPRWIACCALLFFVVGCASLDTGTVAHRSAATSLACRVDDVTMEQIGAYRYQGDGCGRRVTVACTAGALEPRCIEEDATASVDDAPAPPSEEGGPAPFDEEPLPEVEARIRGGLAARRDDVLACTGRERVGVRAAYAPDGSVAFSLQGELEGSPEQRCVEDALDGVRVAATGHAGIVVHLVH